MGRSSRVKVICRRSKKNTRKTQDGNREIITAIETVSTAGVLLPPMIIYKGQAHYKGWTALVQAGDKAFFAISDKGWTSQSIGVEYLTWNLEPNTAASGYNNPPSVGYQSLIFFRGIGNVLGRACSLWTAIVRMFPGNFSIIA